MEEKKEIKVRLSTVISMFIIFILIIALGVTYYFGFVADKKENLGNDKVTNTTENVVSNVAAENQTKEDKVEEDKEDKKEDSSKYKEITKKLDGIDGLYVTEVIKNKDKTYTLKGVLYSQYKISDSELREILDKGKMKINDIEYRIKKDEENPSIYNLYEKEYANYLIKPLNNNEYFLESMMNISDVWKLTDEYRQITIPVDKSCKVVYNYGSEDSDELTVEKAFGDYEKTEAKETSNPWMIFNFEFENDKVVEIYNLVSAV